MSHRSMWKSLTLLGALSLFLLLRMAHSATAGALYVLLALFALTGERNAIRALMLSWLITLWNHGLGPPPSGGAAGRFLVIGMAGLSCLIRWRGLRGTLLISRPVLEVFSLGAFIVLHSLFLSSMREISVLKSLSWAFAATTLTCAWGRLSPPQKKAASNEFFGFLILVMLLSIPLLVTSHGYSRTTGFLGVLSHPQAFGPTMAILASWAFSKTLSLARPSLPLLGVLAISVSFILASQARTAGFAFILGITISVLLRKRTGLGGARSRLPGLRSRRLYLAVLLALTLGLVQARQVEARLTSFVSKGTSNSDVLQVYQNSRGRLMESTWQGFLKRPFTGKGFGLSTSFRTLRVSYDTSTGLPTAAPVEKGVLPLAVLEDLGIFGFIATALWIWQVLRRSARAGLAALSAALTVFLINLGEANLFSPGGMGMLFLITLSWGASHRADGPSRL